MSRKNSRARRPAFEPDSWFEGDSWFEPAPAEPAPAELPEPAPPVSPPEPERQCAAPGCEAMFEPEEPGARYCRRGCKERARRLRRRDEAVS